MTKFVVSLLAALALIVPCKAQDDTSFDERSKRTALFTWPHYLFQTTNPGDPVAAIYKLDNCDKITITASGPRGSIPYQTICVKGLLFVVVTAPDYDQNYVITIHVTAPGVTIPDVTASVTDN